MLMEEPGFQRQPQKPATKSELYTIIDLAGQIHSQCTDNTKEKPVKLWIIDRCVYWMFACLIGNKVRTYKPEDRVNGYTIGGPRK